MQKPPPIGAQSSTLGDLRSTIGANQLSAVQSAADVCVRTLLAITRAGLKRHLRRFSVLGVDFAATILAARSGDESHFDYLLDGFLRCYLWRRVAPLARGSWPVTAVQLITRERVLAHL